jgi:S-formylglutathione hydrolase FrmB
MKRFVFLWILWLFGHNGFAATVDTIWVASPSMKKSYRCVVVMPELPQKEQVRLPVTYLLHGYSGDYSNWIKKVPALTRYADQYRMMIVCPDGLNNWYIDSPVADSIRWETYIGQELPAYIDAHYPTLADRKGRAITGLSMGGHGGLYLGIKKTEVFGACGSMSGGVDLLPFPNKWQLNQLLGDPITQAENWRRHSVMQLIEEPIKQPLAMMIDCGTDDFFVGVNEALHDKLLEKKIPHDYIIRPGKHDWNYWQQALPYQLLFFYRFFYDPLR